MTRRRYLCALAVMLIPLTACASVSTSPATTAPTAPRPTVPLTSAFETASASAWAILPMGDLSDPTNTFWQLFVRARNSRSWVLETPAAVATNGGLVATGGGRQVLVGVLPSQGLTFSPTATTSDSGRSFEPGLVPSPLVSAPDALAIGPSGDHLAVTADGSVLATTDAASGQWHAVTDLSSLRQTDQGRTCGATAVTAVAVLGTRTYLGLACDRSGIVGVVRADGSAASLEPISLPGSPSVDVLRLAAVGPRLVALLGVTAGTTTGYAVATLLPATGKWTVSPTVTPTGPLDASAIASNGDVVVLTGSDPASPTATRYVVTTAQWVPLPAPPAGTACIAVDGADTDALVVRQARLLVYATTGTAWHRVQAIDVPLSLGSSH